MCQLASHLFLEVIWAHNQATLKIWTTEFQANWRS